MKKIFALTAISVALLGAGCSSDDDDANDTDDMEMTDGGMTDGMTPAGPAAVDLSTAPAYTPAAETTMSLAELVPAAGLTQLGNAIAGCPDIAAAASNADLRLTVFAPDDDAFGEDDVQAAIAAGADVCAVLQDHIVVGSVLTAEFLAANVGGTIETMSGRALLIGTDEDDDDADGSVDELTIEGVEVEGADNFATNGVAHVIGSVILPAAPSGGETGGDDGDDGGDDSDDGSDDGGDVGLEGQDGPSLTAIRDGGNSEFITIYNSAAFGSALDDNAWTVFVPNNDAIDDGVTASLGADSTAATAVAQDHIVTEGSLDADALIAASPITSNGGVVLNFADDNGTLTVNGNAATPIATTGSSAIYSIGSLLQ